MINVGTFCELPGETQGWRDTRLSPNPSWLGFGDAELQLGQRGGKQRRGCHHGGAGCRAVPFEHAVVINEKLDGFCWAVGPRRLFHH